MYTRDRERSPFIFMGLGSSYQHPEKHQKASALVKKDVDLDGHTDTLYLKFIIIMIETRIPFWEWLYSSIRFIIPV